MKTLHRALDRYRKKFPGIRFEIVDHRSPGTDDHLFVYVYGGFATVDYGVHLANGMTIAEVIGDLDQLHECECPICREQQTNGGKTRV